MEEHDPHEHDTRLSLLSIFMLVLSFYVLVALLVDTFIKLPKEVSRLLTLIDTGICILFLTEFFYRFFTAKKKLAFLKWGWLDLVSSIPSLDYFRAGRVFRIFRLLRVLRAFRSATKLMQHIFKKKPQGAFTTLTIIAILMVIFSSIGILEAENVPGSNIKTAEDALWWAYVTVTTVGYGDHYPVTTEGRIIAAILMTTGVGLFGTFTGFVASWFVEEKKEEDEAKQKLNNE